MTDDTQSGPAKGVRLRRIAADEAGMRLDRWFRRHYPGLTHARLQKLLRTGQVRVDGRRAKAGLRLGAGHTVRVPPGADAEVAPAATPRVAPTAAEAAALRRAVLYRDDHLIVLNKPPGLATQGGTRTPRHLDAMLGALEREGERELRLVHRLDKDTSGVLLLARGAPAAAALARAFRAKTARKIYWAIVVGVPPKSKGRIEEPLAKKPGRDGERMDVDDDGKPALTLYRVVERAGREAAWLALSPRTGRTHQLRAHCAALGTPILGDGKYGGSRAFLAGDVGARAMHLHARAIRLPHPDGGTIEVMAPLPAHMRATWRFFGFEEDAEADPFAGFEE